MARLTIERPDGLEIIECRTVGDWLEANGWPQLHIFDGDRRLTEADADLLCDPWAELRAADVPGEVATIVYAVIAVIAAAYSIYMANSISIPEVPGQNRNASSSNNELSNRSNKPAKIGQRIPDIWGLEPRAYPLLLSSYRRFDDRGIEYEWSYLLVGRGQHHMTNWRDDDTPLENVSGATLQVYGPNKSPYYVTYQAPDKLIGGEVDRALAPKIMRQSNEIDGATVAAPNASETSTTLLIMPDGWLEITDAASGETLADRFDVGDTINLIDCFGWELVDDGFTSSPVSGIPIRYYSRYDLNDAYVIAAKDATRIQVTPGAQPGWVHIPVGGQYQALSADFGNAYGEFSTIGAEGYAPEFPAGSYTAANLYRVIRHENYSPAGATSGTNIVGPITVTDCEAVIVNLVARQGMYKLNGTTGEPELEAAEFLITMAWGSAGSASTYATVTTNMINRRDPSGTTVRLITGAGRQDVQVTVTRITPTDKAYSGTVVDEVQWRDLYAEREMPTDWQAGIEPGNLTTALLVVQANADAARVKDRKLNCRAVRRLSSSSVADSQIQNILPALHIDQFNGRRQLATLDTTTLNLLASQIGAAGIANTYPDGGTECGYTFDTDQMTYENELQLLCRAVNLRPYHIGGDISFVWEHLRDVSVLITHKDIAPGSFTNQRNLTPSREFSGVELSYKDNAGDTKTISVDPSGKDERIDLQGQHGGEMAQLAAKSARARQLYQRGFVECEVGPIARRLAVGMRALIEDCARRTTAGGEIVRASGLVLTTSQPVPDGVSSVWLSKRNGEAYQVNATKTGANEITLAGGTILPEPVYTDWQERKTRYTVWGPSVPAKPLDMLITEIDARSGTQIRIAAANYDERYFTWP